ncbi:shikimate dehydrogenase [Erythrobacter sp. QSSC1-22B]|uniref:shikimate dehydrogenase family protein n=1 Tax=Erythrobacter sp. QSSC1-22B TaxID=1860125 RepID=UPI000805A2D3|nr:shikimate dehydrogenase [Erythrobacter sp. QSSC1-22B]OBX20004.1 shikimate dehydrogenase [Erythrobacter sp. QSSC1-22B]
MSVPYAEVIGDPIAQSKSPAIHNFWLDKLGIAGEYRATRVAPDGLAAYFAKRRGDPDWRGCNITMPHKQTAIPLLDRVEPLASRVGAVNTVHCARDGALVGRNTDVGGFLEPLADHLDEQHLFRMARVIGTGGAARAIVVGLADRGFTLVLAGRDPDKARALLEELAPDGEHHPVSLAAFEGTTDFPFDDRARCCDLVINASPLGMRGQPPLAFDWSHAPPGSIAYDIVTDPLDTAFLRGAERIGFATIDGLAMLIGQAATAFEHFFGAPPPREHDAQLRERLTA